MTYFASTENTPAEQQALLGLIVDTFDAVEVMAAVQFDHEWYWREKRPDRKGQRCRVIARGAKNSVLVEFEDGERVCTSRYAVRPAPSPLTGLERARQLAQQARDSREAESQNRTENGTEMTQPGLWGEEAA